MKVTIMIGDIADAGAEALCASASPRLSPGAGAGGSLFERGGRDVLRECEALLESASLDAMPAGSVHATTAGALAAKVILHCVASDASHASSPATVAACVDNALTLAARGGCRSIAMPVFASGHSQLSFERAVEAMAAAIAHSGAKLDEVRIVVGDESRARSALAIVRRYVAGVSTA